MRAVFSRLEHCLEHEAFKSLVVAQNKRSEGLGFGMYKDHDLGSRV